MNFLKLCLIISILPVVFYLNASAQEIDVNNMIGKTQSAVIKKYGNPVHQDNSNPAMQCMFYDSDAGRKIFVASEKIVFQAECYTSYKTEKSARSTVSNFISTSIAAGYEVDSVSSSDFRLRKSGVKVDLQLTENKLSKKFEISVKAHKTAD
jgi:hypothetical protein